MSARWLVLAVGVLAQSVGHTAEPSRPPLVATAIDGTPTALTATAKNRRMIFTLAGTAKQLRISLGKDISQIDTRHSLSVLATPAAKQFLVIDTYASAPQPLARCRAGEEMFVRLLDFAAAKPAQIWLLKIASCIDTLVLSEAGGQWSVADRTLTINWLTGPTGKPETRRYKAVAGAMAGVD
jgi:hypothetical protein